MKVEYVCLVTLEERDVRLASVNGGVIVDHPVPPIRTVIRTTPDVKEQLGKAAESRGFRVSANEAA